MVDVVLSSPGTSVTGLPSPRGRSRRDMDPGPLDTTTGSRRGVTGSRRCGRSRTPVVLRRQVFGVFRLL